MSEDEVREAAYREWVANGEGWHTHATADLFESCFNTAWAACVARVREQVLAELEELADAWEANGPTVGRTQQWKQAARDVREAVQIIRAAEEAAHGG